LIYALAGNSKALANLFEGSAGFAHQLHLGATIEIGTPTDRPRDLYNLPPVFSSFGRNLPLFLFAPMLTGRDEILIAKQGAPGLQMFGCPLKAFEDRT
jgi:hypothetical protein